MSETRPLETQIVQLMEYPVKSLPGVECPEALVTENGLANDRTFMLARTSVNGDGHANRLTLREHPELKGITVAYAAGGILLSAEGYGNTTLPLNTQEGEVVPVKAWGGAIAGVRLGKEINAWLANYLGRDDVQILAVPDKHRRILDKSEQRSEAPVFTGRATDGYPLHIASLASLRLLNELRATKGRETISIERFRANIIIDGVDLPPFAEDAMSRMRFEDEQDTIDALIIALCERCGVVEADQTNLQKRGEVLKSLLDLQSKEAGTTRPTFGMWAAPSKLSVGGMLRVGQLLRI